MILKNNTTKRGKHVLVGRFSSYERILGEGLMHYSEPVSFFFLFKMEISSCTLIPLLRPASVHSGSASWDDCGQAFPDELHMNSFSY